MDDHQSANARCLADIGAGIILPQDELDAPTRNKKSPGDIKRPHQIGKNGAGGTDAGTTRCGGGFGGFGDADLVMQTAQDKNKNHRT